MCYKNKLDCYNLYILTFSFNLFVIHKINQCYAKLTRLIPCTNLLMEVTPMVTKILKLYFAKGFGENVCILLINKYVM